MHRRTFVSALGGLGLARAAASEKRTNFYCIEHYNLKSGHQPQRLSDFAAEILPAISCVHSGPKIYLEALVAPQVPRFTAIAGFSSLQELWDVNVKVLEDETVRKASAAVENGTEPAYESLDSLILQATDYSPEIKPEATTPSRIFELRVYKSPTWRQLDALHERFRGPEIKIFHRSGIHPILYGSTFIGPHQPNLVYLIPFADLAAREKAWATFGADPDWKKVRDESVAKSGEIVSDIQISFYRPTSYSPVR